MKENDIHTSDVKSPDGTRNTQRTPPLPCGPNHLVAHTFSYHRQTYFSGAQGQREGGGEGGKWKGRGGHGAYSFHR